MSLQPLIWSEPTGNVYTTHKASDGDSSWRTVAVPRDVTRIHYTGHDADGTFVNSTEHTAFAETVEEARIVIDVLRAGTDHLPGWREQLEAAGFVRSYPDLAVGETLANVWNDERKSGRLTITVLDGSQAGNRAGEISVDCDYHADGANSWHNVCGIDGSAPRVFTYGTTDGGTLATRNGLPEGIDALKAGVAAAIAIRAARIARGGRFAGPLGGPTKKR